MLFIGKKPIKTTIIIFSLVLGIFIVYPNMVKLWSRHSNHISDIEFFIFRYLYFCSLIWILLTINIKKWKKSEFATRFFRSLIVSSFAYFIYLIISLSAEKYLDRFSGLLVFQFMVVCLFCSLLGYIYALYQKQIEKELEIEQLKLENLQSRFEALTNQINPHFFFNSLNAITALVRTDKTDTTLEYINKLSNVFRYILNSDKKGLVPLRNELQFLESFRFLQETKYQDKLKFDINIPEDKLDLMIPVLSLLPLVENVVKHNVIDSENPMHVIIKINKDNELEISNEIHEKIDQPTESGIGLKNLSSRFSLLVNQKIKVKSGEGYFSVFLPLIDKEP
jgi:sensor histidine kinase YesM